ncbi:MAG: 50S ribosomal protein L11 methyltransferase [Clostridia bacterium]|nr:50S ribosomal protein L11 methyltransferase [Clostridia bacterium]
MKYCKATVTTTTEFADTLSVVLIDLGSEGVSVADGEEIKRVLREHTWDYADDSLFEQTDSAVYVSGYYPENHDFSALIEKLNELRAMADLNAGSLELSLNKVDSADYENEWKKYYVPIELKKTVIVPKWQKYGGDKLAVYIDPGMAFGTGSHETTKLCLKFLEKTDLCGKTCADIGCGSGILGAAALKLGAKSCFMADTDEQAVAAAKENCELNGVCARAEIIKGTLDSSVKDRFEVIAANITADVLISLKDAFYGALRSGGILIMSGIIHSRATDVLAAYGELFALESQESDGEWQAMLWKKK